MFHAYPLEASQWDHEVARWSGHFRCLRVDMWGCGSSPPPPAEVSIDGYAASVLDALDERGVVRFAIVGLSMGGYTAFALWRAAPERITAMVLSNTRAGADSDAGRADRERVAERVLSESSIEFLVEPTVDRLLGPRARREAHITDPLRGRIRRCTPAGIAAAQRAMGARPDSSSLLPAIDVPALVIAGADDSVMPRDDVESMARAMPDSRLFEIEDCGHLANLEAPERFGIAVDDFLRSALSVP